jgi:hypothetical protein
MVNRLSQSVHLVAAVAFSMPVQAGSLDLGQPQDSVIAELKERFDRVSEVEGQRDGRKQFLAWSSATKQSTFVWFCKGRLDEKSQPWDGGFPAFVKLVDQRERQFGVGRHFPEVLQTALGESVSLRVAWRDDASLRVHYVEFSQFDGDQTLTVGESAVRGPCE